MTAGRPPVDLDANATSPANEAAWAAFVAAAQAPHAGPAQLLWARAQVAQAVGALPEEVFFTTGGSAATRLAVAAALTAAPKDLAAGTGGQPPPGPRRVLVSALEHRATQAALSLAERQGLCTLLPLPAHGAFAAAAHGLPVPAAQVDLTAPLPANLHLVHCLYAHNETGVVQPVAQVAAAAAAAGAYLHTDAVQAIGRLPCNFAALGADLLSFAGHKLGAVGNAGVLLVRAHSRPWQILQRQPWAFLGPYAGWVAPVEGTPGGHAAAAVSLAVALTQAPTAARWAEVAALRDAMEARLIAGAQAQAGVRIRVLGAGSPRLANTSCLAVAGLEAEALLMGLDLAGYAISAGAACASGALTPSPSLLAMGCSSTEAREVIRISLPASVQASDLAAFVPALLRIVSLAAGQHP